MGEVLTVILASTPGVLTALGTFWYTVVKQRRSDKRADARIVWEDREKAVDVKRLEDENAMGFWKAFAIERKKAHERDIERLEKQLGECVRELDQCRKGHRKVEIRNARMLEIMRLNGLLSDTEEHKILRMGEGDSDDDSDPDS